MASLESGIVYLLFRHRRNCECSLASNGTTVTRSTSIRTTRHLQNLLQNQCNPTQKNFPCHLDRFDAGSGAALPFFPRHSCHATSIGAASAIEE
jgi:hypothetical protein